MHGKSPTEVQVSVALAGADGFQLSGDVQGNA